MNLKASIDKAKAGARKKANNLGWWMELVQVAFLFAAWYADTPDSQALFARMAFAIMWAGLSLSIAVSFIRLMAVAFGKTTTASERASAFDWGLDAVVWTFLMLLGWTYTGIVYLVCVFIQDLLTLAQREIIKNNRVPQVDRSMVGVEATNGLAAVLFADGEVVSIEDYLLTDNGLAVREESINACDLKLKLLRDGQTLFVIEVLAQAWPGLFKPKAPASLSKPEQEEVWPDEIKEKKQ